MSENIGPRGICQEILGQDEVYQEILGLGWDIQECLEFKYRPPDETSSPVAAGRSVCSRTKKEVDAEIQNSSKPL